MEAGSRPRHPVPSPDGLNAEFYAHCATGHLAIQRCDGCLKWRHLPRHMCPDCGSPEWSWRAVSGDATLYSWTVTHRAMHPAFAENVPYVVAIVELVEGVRLVAPLRDVIHEQLTLDRELHVDFERISESVSLPIFRPR